MGALRAMINFPVFDRLDVTGYGLFPGSDTEPGLHITFGPGLTLVLGANGLGKSTLVIMLYRLLTGPFDIPGLSGRADLGSISLEPKGVPGAVKSVFAQRVSNGAESATGRLEFNLGQRSVVVERLLSDLSLIRFEVDGAQRATDEQESFQKEIAKLVGVWSFGDWILLLRHMVFYFEDRRALVWDASAQRQLLRFLFLPATTARKWTQDERFILKLDSDARNLSYAIYKEEGALASSESMVISGADVRQELKALEELQKVDIDRREDLENGLVEGDAARQTARLRHVKAEQEREARYRELERAKLISVEARFPKHSDTARYILAQLLTEAECLVCGNHVPATAVELESRIKHEQCVVCGSDLAHSDKHIPAARVADRRAAKATAALGEIEPELTEAVRQLAIREAEYSTVVQELAELNAKIAERSARIDALVKLLPPEETELHRQRVELATMRNRLETMQAELVRKRQAFRRFVNRESKALVARSGDIKSSFERYAEGFLLEQIELAWSPQKSRVGQTGDLIEFPAFELDMTGTDFPSPVRRTGPEQVSESQREFIDLAFRMALMEVAGSDGVGSLVIDAPESSLDAVFVTRAAMVLARFAKPSKGNRLVITSNLVEGKLIPQLLTMSASHRKRLTQLVDLFKIAEPTAAIRKLRDEYQEVMTELMRSVDDTNPSRRPPTRRRRS
jgi:AAA domain